MLDQETKRKIDSARNILVGKVPDPKAQVEQITTALIYKFMDDMDKETVELGGKAGFFVEGLKEYSWSRLLSRELSGQERLDLYTRAINELSKAKEIPELFRMIFKDAYLPYRDAETLNLFLKEINNFTYENSESLGNAFEYLLSVLGSQGDAGQFRTPRHIIDFIVEVVDPKKQERILDPACGTAGFLISAYKHIKRLHSSNYKEENYVQTFAETDNRDITTVEIQKNGKYKGDLLTPDDRKKLAANIVGYDISPDMVRLSLVNLYLHGFSSPQIFEYDSLTYEDRWDDTFDVILANPPFMTPKGGIRPHKRFQIQANRAEVLFVYYIAEHLKLNGRAGIIVPEGIIFQSSGAYKNLRKMLIDDHYLWAVVSLPSGVFNPYSGVKTSILFLDRELAKMSNEVLFAKVENDGFDLGAQRRRIEQNDLPRAFEVIKKFEKVIRGEKKYLTYGDVRGIAHTVKKDEIVESGDYSLSGEKYRKDLTVGIRESMERMTELLKPYQDMFDTFTKQAQAHQKQIAQIQESVQPFLRYVNEQQEMINELYAHLSEPIRQMQKAFESSAFKSALEAAESVRKMVQGSHYPVVDLGEVCEIARGGSPRPINDFLTQDSNGINWIKIGDAKIGEKYIYSTEEKIRPEGLSKTRMVHEGDFILSNSMSFGRPYILKTSGAIHDGWLLLRLKSENILPDFLYWILSSSEIKKQFEKSATGGVVKNLNSDIVRKVQIPLPSREIQKQIAEKVDNYQRVIDGAKQVIENWRPNINIDPEWEMVELGDPRYFDIESGGTPDTTKPAYWNGGVSWVTLVDLPADDLITEITRTERTISKEGLDNSSAKLLPEKTVLISSRATIGRIGISRVPLATNQGYKNIIIKDFSKANEKFVALMTTTLVDQMKQLATGGTFKEISKSAISKLKIPLPPLEAQERFVAEIEIEQKALEANKMLIGKFEEKIAKVVSALFS